MKINNLYLKNFRNYPEKNWQFSDATTLFIGPNASGKTNIIEALYLLATGNSFRATVIEEMIKQGNEVGNIQGLLDDEDELEVTLTKGEVMGKSTPKRIFKINGVEKKKTDFVGNLRCVLFRPEDIEIVIGSPSVRRNYMDSVLEQIDREYARVNLSYSKGLRQRNRLLSNIFKGKAKKTQLYFWDNLLVKNGQYINRKREEFIDYINNNNDSLFFKYLSSEISEPALKKHLDAEINAGNTLIGPHRDDFVINKHEEQGNRNLSMYGSRGEQRMAVLYLKILELEYINEETKERPVLLLDDIFSELDKKHREKVFDVVKRQQTIMTTAERGLIENEFFDKIRTVDLSP